MSFGRMLQIADGWGVLEFWGLAFLRKGTVRAFSTVDVYDAVRAVVTADGIPWTVL